MFIHSLTHNGEGAEYLRGYVALVGLGFVLVAMVVSIIQDLNERIELGNAGRAVGRALVKLWRWLF